MALYLFGANLLAGSLMNGNVAVVELVELIGGPHQVFTKIHQHHFNTSEETNFLADQYNLFRMGFQVNLDVTNKALSRVTTPHSNSWPNVKSC